MGRTGRASVVVLAACGAADRVGILGFGRHQCDSEPRSDDRHLRLQGLLLSPDPAGIAYLPAQDRLLISDSEVNEMPLFQGFNLYTANPHGLRRRLREGSRLLPGALRPGDRHSERQAVHR